MVSRHIDLNADLGEGMGDDEAMLDIVTSANVACGGHAGDVETMYRTLRGAAERGVVVGAHPGYLDREHFGRRDLDMVPEEIGRMVVAQVGALAAIAALVPVDIGYVKLHGALANLAARDDVVADAVVGALTTAFPGLAVLAISGTRLEHAARVAGTPVFSEIFADRAYRSTGQLVPRGEPGAVLHDPAAVTDRIAEAVRTGRMPVVDGAPIELAADSICVHGDTEGAVDMAARLRSRLESDGVALTGFVQS